MRFWILVRGRGRIYIKFIKFLPALFENLFSEVVFYQLLVILILNVLHLKRSQPRPQRQPRSRPRSRHGHGHGHATLFDHNRKNYFNLNLRIDLINARGIILERLFQI